MLITGNQPKRPTKDLNKELLTLKGHLSVEEAMSTLAQFLYHNITFTVELLMGIKLYPYQALMIRSWFKRGFCLNVWGRGNAKSFLVAIFAVLYCVFYPNTKIVILAQNFRTAKRIFDQMQKMVYARTNFLLAACFPEKPIHTPDCWSWKVNGGEVMCLPLAGGDRIRGTRADVLIIDEFLLIPQDIYEQVLLPFLVVRTDLLEQQKTREVEDELIAQGKMKEEERKVFVSRKKLIALSSASYSFENLFKIYKDWIDKTQNGANAEHSYFVSQLSYEAMPLDLIDKSIVMEAQSGGNENPAFLREYCARFTEEGDSYFSPRKMALCTVPDGQTPTIEIIGEKDAEYVLAIDPSYSSSKSSDDFAMSLIKLNRKEKTGVLVHNYAVAGGDLKDHIEYAHYLFSNFNIVMVIADKAGGETFYQACNNSPLFKNMGYELKIIDADFDDLDTYQDNIRKSRLSYSFSNKRILYLQNFSSLSVRQTANEWLQNCIDSKKIWFASHPSSLKFTFNELIKQEVPEMVVRRFFENMNSVKAVGSKRKNMADIDPKRDSWDSIKLCFIDQQGAFIDLTKKECALVEVTVSPGSSNMTFDLPRNLRKSTAADKVRKDSYSTLLLGARAMKIYNDIFSSDDGFLHTFIPKLIN